MELLRHLLLIAVAACLVVGCATGFHHLPQGGMRGNGVWQNRVNPSGNAVLSESGPLPDTLLFERRLNGGIGAQIVGNGNLIIVPTYNDRIYFLDAKRGGVESIIKTESAVEAAVAVDSELFYYAEQSGGDRITCFNLVDGRVLWRYDVFDPQGPPIVAGEDLFIASRDGKLSRLDRWTGREIWKHEEDSQIYTAAVVDENEVFFGNAKGEFVCLTREKGEEQWRFATSGTIFAAPMVSDKLYGGSADGNLYAINKDSGQMVWMVQTAGQIFTTPVLSGNQLCFGSHDRSIYCVDATGGGVLWSYDTGEVIDSSPIAVGDYFLSANTAGQIFIFTRTGKLTRTFETKPAITAPLSYIDGRLYVGTDSRRIYCFGPAQ